MERTNTEEGKKKTVQTIRSCYGRERKEQSNKTLEKTLVEAKMAKGNEATSSKEKRARVRIFKEDKNLEPLRWWEEAGEEEEGSVLECVKKP